MSERAKVLLVMWGAYGLGLVVMAWTSGMDAAGFGFLTAIVLAVVTVKLLKK